MRLVVASVPRIAMYKSVNRWLYGPTPEERVRSWQQRLRQESRQLDREMGRVRLEP